MLARVAVVFVFVSGVFGVSDRVLLAQSLPPFVVGFERFARYGDMSPVDAGELLISELSCTACHASPDPSLAPKHGPRLAGAGNRLQADWIKSFLLSPQEIDPGTTMPSTLHGIDREEQRASAEAIAAYLESQREAFPILKAGGALPVVHEFWSKGDAGRGRELYHKVGCVACHEPDADYEPPSSVPSPIDALIEQLEPEEIEEMGLARMARRVESVPHGKLREKYSIRSLTMLLIDPASVRPDARMPSMRLQPAEAADIATYLMESQPITDDLAPAEADSNLIARGQRLFIQLRCVNCHDLEPKAVPNPARPLSELQLEAKTSCLQNANSRMPHYQLEAMQVEAILARLSNLDQAPPTADQTVRQQMTKLNCYACHQRTRKEDDAVLGGVGRFRKPYFETSGEIDLGDEGRLPPPLTNVGRKLLPSALESVFTAKASPRRPFMTIRMPAYHSKAAAPLITALPEADQADATTENELFGDARGLAEVGRELVNTGCVECHEFRGESLPGAIGVDIDAIHTRVYPQWFLEFIRDPGKLKARTRMPTFFPDGQSNRKDLLGGDVDRQIAAIWHYLKNADPLPEKIASERSKNYELKPDDRPLIQRTFMPQVGTHAIAVGLPGGLNYAFDAERVLLSLAWKGRFLDARGTWFERFAPPAEPLGENVITFPDVFPFAATNTSQQLERTAGYSAEPPARFGGYQLDPEGVPTFLYETDSWQIEDRIEAIDGETLLRTWTLRRATESDENLAAQPVTWCVLAGEQLRRTGAMSMSNERGLTATVIRGVNGPGKVVDAQSRKIWLVTMPEASSSTDAREIKLEYRW